MAPAFRFSFGFWADSGWAGSCFAVGCAGSCCAGSGCVGLRWFRLGWLRLRLLLLFPKLLQLFCLAPCWLWLRFLLLTCSLFLFRLCWFRPDALSCQASHHRRFASVRSPGGGGAVVCWSVCPDQSRFDQPRLDQSRSDH